MKRKNPYAEYSAKQKQSQGELGTTHTEQNISASKEPSLKLPRRNPYKEYLAKLKQSQGELGLHTEQDNSVRGEPSLRRHLPMDPEGSHSNRVVDRFSAKRPRPD